MTVPANPQPDSDSTKSSWKILWRKNTTLLTQQPKFLWYFLGIVGILLQEISMLGLAGWQLIKISKHDYISLKSSIAVASLFLLFVIYLAVNIWKTISFGSVTLGGVLCGEILFIPVAYYLFQSHQMMISISLMITIIITIPIFLLRSAYCTQHAKELSQ